jgi:hypothetical protein
MSRNKYFRSTPLEYGLVSLGGYLRFWALIFLVVTAWLAFVKKEDAVSENDPDMDVKKVYKVMWSIIRLKSKSSQPTSGAILTIRYPVLPHRSPSLQDRFPSQRFGNIAQTPRKGSP